MADEQHFTQEQVNGLVGKARDDGRAAATKELLKALGFESIEVGQEFVKTSKAAQKDFETKLSGLTTEKDGAVLKFKVLSLDQKASEIGAELGLTPAKAKQVVKLLDITAATFDPENNTLKASFETFLGADENKHFVTTEEAAKPGGSRKPNSGTKPKEGEPDKFDQLLGLIKV